MIIPLFTVDEIFRFFLLLVRISAVILTFPVLNSRVIPSQVKIILIVMLSFSLYPAIHAHNLLFPNTLIHLGFYILGEMFIGMLVGFTGQIIFTGLQLAGTLMDNQMGLSMANTVDPQNGHQITITSNFQYIMGILIFLAVNGHHALITVMAESLHSIPLLQFNISMNVGKLLVILMGKAFVMAIRIAAPVIVTILLTNIAMGIIARTVPQMNIFILSFPMNLGIGTLVLTLALPYILWSMRNLFSQMNRDLFMMIHLIAGG